MNSEESHDAPSTPLPRRRSRLHLVYYVLAIFDLLTVGLSLFIIAQIAGIFTESVAVNQVWADRLGEYSTLSRLATDVNLPGNDVFESRDVARETERLETAIAAFHAKMDVARTDLEQNVDDPRVDELLAACDEANISVDAMVAEARRIFSLFENDRPELAGERMASMDRHLTSVNAALATLGSVVRDIQKSRFAEQQSAADLVRTLEFVIAVLIVFMVIGVTIYGHVLARRMREASDEVHRYRVHLEELVAERTRQLEATHQRLRLSDRLASIGTLAAGLGHDINNMLFPMRCRIDTLEEAATESSTRRELAAVRTSVAHLQQLSDGLRLLALDPDDPQASGGVTRVARWWGEVSSLLRTALPAEAELASDLPDDLPDLAIAPHALTQAVFNLVLNAGEALDGAGHVRVSAAATDDRRAVRLVVADDGTGMTDEVRRQALDPFFTTKVRGVSTGLGLALVQGIVKKAGGTVEIDSAPDRGTSVILTLATDSCGAPSPKPRGRWAATVSLADRRIASFVTALLESEGFAVSAVDDSAAISGSLWVTDAAPESIEPARDYLSAGDGRRVIAWGASTDSMHQWRTLGALLIDGNGGLPAFQEAIRSVMTAGDGTNQ